MLNLADSRNFARTLAALGLFVGPMSFLIASVIDPAWADDGATYLQEVAAGETMYLAAGVLWTVGSLFLVFGMLGVVRLMRDKGVTLGQVGAGLMALGSIMLSAAVAFFGVDVALARVEDRALAVEIWESLESVPVAGAFYFVAFLGGIVLGSLLLAIALFRRKTVPVWSPVVLIVSTVVGFVGQTQLMSVISIGLLAVALFPLGQKIWSLSDDQWAQWAPLASAGTPEATGADGTVPA